jgi:replicative DNA helicase
VSDLENFQLPAFAPEQPKEAPPINGKKKAKQQTAIVNPNEIEQDLPCNIHAEKTIIGAVLNDNNAFLQAAERLTPDDFFLDSHKRIFLRMSELMNKNQAVDFVTLSNELALHKESEYIGGISYLASLTEGLPMRPMIEDYIRIVKDKAMARGIMLLSSVAITRCADQSEPSLEIAGELTTQLEEVISGGIHRGLESVSNLTVEVLDKYKNQSQLTESPGLSFGIPGIDEATGGIQDGEQVVVGCFSGVGKTTLLAQIIAANCPKGHPAAMFLIEPTRHTFLRQLWTIVADVRYTAATKPWLANREEREKLQWAAFQVAEWPLYIFDKSNLSLDEQIAHSRLAIHRHGVEIIGVDYLQRMKVKSVDKNDDTRLKVGRASTSNADLVKGTKCRSILLSQLSRSGGMNTLPTMDKLRESGQIENDAATIVLLHLKYDEEQGHFTDEGAAIIPKQRFGVPCNVALYKDQNSALWCSGKKEDTTRRYDQPQLYDED